MRHSYVFVIIASTFLATSDALVTNQRLLRAHHFDSATDADFEERGAPKDKLKELARQFGLNWKDMKHDPRYLFRINQDT
ncbi:hypothetical protein GN244_ATG08234 [Phytophthora infestans]|uniref:Secreted RxLR effector peptide protein n=1 Tax=Phytophthora infestans TaxID=4787 RepID=A0A833WKL0_PHYIN|nr:hypothetical protein GN244_ATG08234 [Phytophthora infestans]